MTEWMKVEVAAVAVVLFVLKVFHTSLSVLHGPISNIETIGEESPQAFTLPMTGAQSISPRARFFTSLETRRKKALAIDTTSPMEPFGSATCNVSARRSSVS